MVQSTNMVETFKAEHFFQGKLAEGKILDDVIVRTKSYDRKSLDLTEGDPVVITEYTVPLEQNTFVMRVAEMTPPPELIDETKPHRTLVIIGGGASPGPGTNLKLGVELIQKLQSKDQKTDINRILFVSNPSGAPRETQHVDKENLQHSANLVTQCLKQLRIDSKSNLLFMGFSAGGALSLETAALFEKEDTESKLGSRDLILIEPVATVDYDPKIMGKEFFIGNALAILKRSKGLPIGERLKRLWKESQNSWATLDGVPSFSALIKDAMQGKKRHLGYAEAYGMSHKKMATVIGDVHLLANDFTKEDRKVITGNVLIIENGGSKVVNQPATRLNSGETTFPHAKSTKGVILEDVWSHSFTMADDGRTMDAITSWMLDINSPKTNLE